MIDGILAVAVLLGLVLNAMAGWWWADPAAGYMLVFYAGREVREIFYAGREVREIFYAGREVREIFWGHE